MAYNGPLPLPVGGGGTGDSTLTSHGFLYGNGVSAVGSTAELSNGQLLIGSTGNPAVPANITAGTNITVSNAPGAVTISTTNPGGGGNDFKLLASTNITSNVIEVPFINLGYWNTLCVTFERLTIDDPLGSLWIDFSYDNGVSWVITSNSVQQNNFIIGGVQTVNQTTGTGVYLLDISSTEAGYEGASGTVWINMKDNMVQSNGSVNWLTQATPSDLWAFNNFGQSDPSYYSGQPNALKLILKVAGYLTSGRVSVYGLNTVGGTPGTSISTTLASITSVSVSGVTGDGTPYYPIFNNVIVDSLSDYNASTGIWTAKKKGVYHVDMTLSMSDLVVDNNLMKMELRNFPAATFVYYETYCNPGAERDAVGNLTQRFNGLISLNAGDAVQPILTVAGNSVPNVTINVQDMANSLSIFEVSTATGVNTGPNLSRTFAYYSTDVADVLGAGVDYQFIYDNVQFDTNSNYDAFSGVWTAQRSGTYWISATFKMMEIADQEQFNHWIQFSNGTIIQKTNHITPATDVDRYQSNTVSGYFYMAAGDSFTTWAGLGGGSTNLTVGFTSSPTQVETFLNVFEVPSAFPTGSQLPWIYLTNTSQDIQNNVGYTTAATGLTTLTLPITAPFGSVIEVTGKGAGGWKIAQNFGQTIYDATTGLNTTPGDTGYLQSTSDRDSIRMVCVSDDLEWNVLSSSGIITVV